MGEKKNKTEYMQEKGFENPQSLENKLWDLWFCTLPNNLVNLMQKFTFSSNNFHPPTKIVG